MTLSSMPADWAWLEITDNTHGHGGEGWEFGTCLWSPSADSKGRDRYQFMRLVEPGDRILHAAKGEWEDTSKENLLGAWSYAEGRYKEVEQEPPEPGGHADRPSYYRIPLRDYQELETPLSISRFTQTYREELRWEIQQGTPKYYPFTTYGEGVRTAQGLYLGRCTPRLFALFVEALEIEEGSVGGEPSDGDPQKEYAEGRRRLREQYSFSRNPKLVADAKDYYGFTCQGCGFNFEAFYGEIGEGYIECHHLNPLAQQSQDEPSTLDDVRVLCANCHRVVHRRDPPLSLEELRQRIEGRR